MTAAIWNTMSLFEQLSNIDGEVTRLIEDHERYQRGESDHDCSLDYIRNIVKLIDMTFDDPQNVHKKVAVVELSAEVVEIIRYLNGEYSAKYITDYWHQYTEAIS